MPHKSRQLRSLIRTFFVRSNGRLAWTRIAVIAVLLVAYLALQPWLVRSFGLPLPGFASVGQIADVESANAAPRTRAHGKADDAPETFSTSKSVGTDPSPGESDRASHDAPKGPKPPADSQAGVAQFLREVRHDVFESPAGLLYAPGSAQGHRIEHVLAHARDNPERSGQHGVFDPGDRATVFRLIDDAYKQAVSGSRTSTKHEGKRTVHTVDLGRQIGYVGGQSGKGRKHPRTRHVRLVLQGKNVITAFPVIP